MKKLIVMLAMIIMSVVSMADNLAEKGIGYLEVLGYKVESIDNGYSIKDVDANANCRILTFKTSSKAREFFFEEETKLEDEGYVSLSYDKGSMVWANKKTMRITGYSATDCDVFTFEQDISGKDSKVAEDVVRAIGLK